MTLLEEQLPLAVATDRLDAAFQPLVDIRTGRIVGAEVLARWTHPELGAVPPSAFIPAAVRGGLIDAVGVQMLHRGWAAAQHWRVNGHPIGVSINVSAIQLGTPGFVEAVAALADPEVGIRGLTLEVTESELLPDAEVGAARLRELRDLGALVSIDDYGTGTGTATIDAIESLPVTEIKIDISLVHDESPAGDAALAEIAAYATARGIDLVAEGIETPAQLARMRELGCARAQGYLVGRPMTEDALTRLLSA